MKICPKCKLDETKVSFSKNKTRKDGLQDQCKDCQKKISKKNYQFNSSQVKINTKIWQKANSNRNKKVHKAWVLANIDKVYASNAKRRAKKLRASPAWANSEFEVFAIQEMYALAKLRTRETGVEHHVDHIVPISSRVVQGFHCLANLQILEAKENLIKSNQIWPNMP